MLVLVFLVKLLVLCNLLLQLCELGLKLRLPLGLGLLVGVDLAGSGEFVERDAGILCDDGIDLLGSILQARC